VTIEDVAAEIVRWAQDDELIRQAAADAGLIPTRADVEALCAQADAERNVVAAAQQWHKARQAHSIGPVITALADLAAAVDALNAVTPAKSWGGES
jgi:hypothetical protein